MATLTKSDLAVFEVLAVVRLNGYKPKPDEVNLEDGSTIDTNVGTDQPGEANWLVSQYGMQPDELDPERYGILWTDYDSACDRPWEFAILIAGDEVEALTEMATAAGYEVVEVEPVAEPIDFGDGHGGTVTILKHPDGWVIAN